MSKIHTLSQDTDAVSAVWFAVLGGKFILRIDHEFSESFADVLDANGEVIGSANQMYSDGGWAVSTRAYGGYVAPEQVVFTTEPLKPSTLQRCSECGHIAQVSNDCTSWACGECGRIQAVSNG